MKLTKIPLLGFARSSLVFQFAIFATFLLASNSFASDPSLILGGTYYVSADADSATATGTIDLPFKTIMAAAHAADDHQAIAANKDKRYVILVKAGVYEEQVTLNTLQLENTLIEGYAEPNVAIDPAAYYANHEPGAPLNGVEMPLLVGGGEENGEGRLTLAFRMGGSNKCITLRNFQIKGYANRGVHINGAVENTLENIVVDSITASKDQIQAAIDLAEELGKDKFAFGGVGITCQGNDCNVRYCSVINCWGTNISIAGGITDGTRDHGYRNTFEHCKSYCLEDNPVVGFDGSNGTDYYFIFDGDDNTIRDCHLKRAIGIRHGGHGFITLGGNGNNLENCTSENVSEGIQVLALRTRAEENTFTNCDITGGSIVLSTEANDNTFTTCTVEGGSAGVQFWRSFPESFVYNGSTKPARDNNFLGCIFKNSRFGLDFNIRDNYEWGASASNNCFSNCEFDNIYALIRTQRPHVDTQFKGGSKFFRVLHLHHDDGFPSPENQLPEADFQFEAHFEFRDSTFFENGFQTPQGIGNVTLDGIAKYPPTADIRSGLVGHWTFDEVEGNTVQDSSLSSFNGSLHGSPSVSPDGKLGDCIYFDGLDDFVDIGDQLDLVGSDMTIAAWMNAEEFVAFGGIVSKIGNYRLGLGGSAAGNQISGAALGSNIQADAGRATPLNKDQWYHVAVVLDLSGSQTVKIYVDGILRTNDGVELTSVRHDVGHPLQIGRYGGGGFFKGLIDDVRIYDRALDIYDMKALADYRDPSSGLVGHWKFDEETGDVAYDSSKDNLNGDLVGDTSWDADGKLGGSIYLDGQGDYVSIGDELDLVGSDMTISAWIRTEEWGFAGIVSKLGSGGNYRVALHNSDAGLFGQVKTNPAVYQSFFALDTDMTLNSWHHVAVVLDSTNQQTNMYIDGVLCSQTAYTLERGGTTGSLVIGATGGNSFKGNIDDVRIYDRALDNIGVKTLADYRDPSSGLVGHWKFDEEAGDVAYDSAKDSLNGDLVGDTNWDADGKLGGSIYLDGQGDYVSIGDELDLVGSDMTISAWIRTEEWGFAGIVSKLGSGGNYRVALHNSDAGLFGQVKTNPAVYQSFFALDTDMTLNSWHHVAVVLDSTNQQTNMYIDGVLCSQTAYTLERGGTTGSLVIGATGGNSFKGNIDDVRIYDRALDDVDVEFLSQLK